VGVGQGPVYQAMYDYDAQDDDEVGFCENDLVVNVEPIDEGWMFGTIQRTGMRGMLPANYVERIQWQTFLVLSRGGGWVAGLQETHFLKRPD